MLNLTKPERLAISILIAALILGVGVSVYKRSRPAPIVEIKKFDIDTVDADSEVENLLSQREKININEAGLGELMRLKGVGKTLARRMIDYRDSNGSFVSPDEIKKVKGIGKALFEKIKDNIVLE